MENTARLEPGLMANQFNVVACQNSEALRYRLSRLKELGIDACAYCNGCRISYNPETGSAQANCSATVHMGSRMFEGPLLAQEVPEVQLTYPIEVPALLGHADASVVEQSQGSADEQAA